MKKVSKKKQGHGRKPRDPQLKKEYLEERLTMLCKYLRTGLSIAKSCQACDIHYNTYQLWKNKAKDGMSPYVELWHKVEKAYVDAEAFHAGKIVKASEKGDWKASAYWLERRRPEDWAKKEQLTQEIKQETTVKDISDMTVEERKLRIKVLEQKVQEAKK